MIYPSKNEFEYVGQEKYKQIHDHGTGTVETHWKHKDGHLVDVLLSSTPFDLDDLLKGVTFTALDITDRKQTEKEKEELKLQLLQTQKMEAIGTLAGGIAHDFNNILSGVLGYTELAINDVGDMPDTRRKLDQVLKAGGRASELVKQILTFSRHQKREHIPISPITIVKEVLKFIRSSIPATIEIKQTLNSKSHILADATNIHQLMP